MDSPVQSRRSRRIAPVDGGNNEEILPEELHNVDEERDKSRKQAENEFLEHGSPSTNKRLSYLDKNANEHFQSCIQLAAENKINVKNAFSFKLIDLLHSKFSKKKMIKDFTEVSSSLDAGVKIYSCRVDNVHSDTLKMATTICNAKHKNIDNDSENEESDVPKTTKQQKIRNARKTTLATNVNLINKKDEDIKFCQSIFSIENLITSSAIFDGINVRWHLDTKDKFWRKKEREPVKTNFIKIEFPEFPENVVISNHFKNFCFGENDPVVLETEVEKSSSAFNFDSSAQIDFNNDTAAFDNDMDASVNDDGAEPMTEFTCISKMMSSSDFVSDITTLISSETSDYRYFNFNLLQKNWITRKIRHWNPLKTKKEFEDKKPKNEKNDPINIGDFSNIKEIYNKKDKGNACYHFVSQEKLKITSITHFNLEEFFRLKEWRGMFLIPSSNNNDEQPSDFEEMINNYDYNNPNDSQNFLPERHEDDYNDNDSVPNDVHEAIERNEFMGDNLLEIPNKVSKIQLPYMVKDKSVNMKQLKSEIWSQIEDLEPIEIENPIKETGISFSSICKTIITKDSKKVEELSVPILFNAILQLANDKNLLFLNDESNSLADFVVTVSN